MQSARWERDRRVNSDSFNTVNRGNARKREEMENVGEEDREDKQRQTRALAWLFLFLNRRESF